MRKCDEAGCENIHYGRGKCRQHYNILRSQGGYLRNSEVLRFLAVVTVDIRCWECEEVVPGLELHPWKRLEGDVEKICLVCRKWFGHQRFTYTASEKLIETLVSAARDYNEFFSMYAYTEEGVLEWQNRSISRSGRVR